MFRLSRSLARFERQMCGNLQPLVCILALCLVAAGFEGTGDEGQNKTFTNDTAPTGHTPA